MMPWHPIALRMFAQGHNYSEISRAVSRAPGTVRRFLDPEAGRRSKEYTNQWQKDKYRHNPAWRQKKLDKRTAYHRGQKP